MGIDQSRAWESVRTGLKKAITAYYLLFFAPLVLMIGSIGSSLLTMEVPSEDSRLLSLGAAIALYALVHYAGIYFVIHGAVLCTAVPASTSSSGGLIRGTLWCFIPGKLIELGGIAFFTVLFGTTGGVGWSRQDCVLMGSILLGLSHLLLFVGCVLYLLFIRSIGYNLNNRDLSARVAQFMWFWLGGIVVLFLLPLLVLYGAESVSRGLFGGPVGAVLGIAWMVASLAYILALFSGLIRLLRRARRAIADYLAGGGGGTAPSLPSPA